MSQGGFFKCISNSFDHGLISLERREWAEKRYKELIKAVPTTKEAKERLLLEASHATLEKERRGALNEKVRKDVIGYVTRYRDRQGRQNLAEGLERYIEALPAKRDAELAALLSKLDQYLMKYKKGAIAGDLRRQGGKLGNIDLIVLTSDIQKELRGEKSGNPEAKAHASALADVMDEARQTFNALGGTIPKLDKWGGPQIHRWEKIAKAGREKWVNFVYDLLDHDRMIDFSTGQPFKEAELKSILGETWGRGTTDGMIDLEPSMVQTGKGALYKQHLDHRFMHFKSADAWMKYAREFGDQDFFAVTMAHLSGMARDITAMRYLGTNPPAMMNYINQFAKKHVTTAGPLNTIRAEQFATMQSLMTRRNEIIAGVVQKSDPTFWESRGVEMMAELGSRIGGLHAKMADTVERIHKLRMEGDLRRKQADVDQMLVLQQELDGIQREIQAAKNDPLYDTQNPIPMGAMIELNSINSEYLRLLDDVRIDAIEVDRAVLSATERKLLKAQGMWDTWRGATNRVQDHRLANVAATVRNLNVASKLGGAMVSAIADLSTQKITRSFLRMKQGGLHDIIGGMGKEVSQLSRAEAVRMQILAEDQIRSLRETTRFATAVDAPMWSSYIADRSLAITGLTQYTEMGKRAFAKDFFANFGDFVDAKLSYAKLPDAWRRTLQRNDISPGEWDRIATTTPHKPTPESASFLLPEDVMRAAGEDTARKYSAMMYNERQYAIIEPSLAAQTAMTMGTSRGTVIGELLRSATQFKSFGITIVQLHGRRFLDEMARDSKAGASYAASLLIYSTILGALVVQLKDLIAGRDPRPMDNANFWFASTLQGGGWGIYGDFLNSAGNRMGRGTVATIAGPTLGQLEDLGNLTVGNIKEAWAGKKTNFGSELARTIQGNTPFASTWYARRAVEALVFDELQRKLDNDAHSAFRRRIDTRRKDYNQNFWWSPGEQSPARAPDATAAFGSR